METVALLGSQATRVSSTSYPYRDLLTLLPAHAYTGSGVANILADVTFPTYSLGKGARFRVLIFTLFDNESPKHHGLC